VSAYWAGFATPFLLGVVVLAAMGYADRVQSTRIGPHDVHAACGYRHAHRPWLPWRLMKVTVVPATNWRYSHGAPVPLWLGFGDRGRSVRSNTPQWAEMRAEASR